MGTHRFIPASAGHIWLNCILHPHLSKIAAETEATDEMEEGTRLHEELHKANRDPNYDIKDLEIIKAIGEIRALRERLGGDSNILYSASEELLDWGGEFGEDVGGSPDWFAISKDGRLAVADFKSRGTLGVIEQLTIYSILVARRARKAEMKIKEVIAQCLSADEPTELVLSAEEILSVEAELEFQFGLIMSEGAEAQGVVGPWCGRCNGCGICPAFLDSIEKESSDLVKIGKEPARASDDRLAAILDKKSSIQAALETLSAYAKERAGKNKPIATDDGWWDLKPGNRVRTWLENAAEVLRAKYKIAEPEEKSVKSMKSLQPLLEKGVKFPQEGQPGFTELFQMRQNQPSLVFRKRGEETEQTAEGDESYLDGVKL